MTTTEYNTMLEIVRLLRDIKNELKELKETAGEDK